MKMDYPGDYIYDENIIVDVKKGRNNNIAIANFEDLDITFPKNGVFIAVEWLIIDDNYYETKMKFNGQKKKRLMKGYNPSIGASTF